MRPRVTRRPPGLGTREGRRRAFAGRPVPAVGPDTTLSRVPFPSPTLLLPSSPTGGWSGVETSNWSSLSPSTTLSYSNTTRDPRCSGTRRRRKNSSTTRSRSERYPGVPNCVNGCSRGSSIRTGGVRGGEQKGGVRNGSGREGDRCLPSGTRVTHDTLVVGREALDQGGGVPVPVETRRPEVGPIVRPDLSTVEGGRNLRPAGVVPTQVRGGSAV